MYIEIHGKILTRKVASFTLLAGTRVAKSAHIAVLEQDIADYSACSQEFLTWLQ